MGIRILCAMMWVAAGCSAERSDQEGTGEQGAGVGPGAGSGRTEGGGAVVAPGAPEGPEGPHGIGEAAVEDDPTADAETGGLPGEGAEEGVEPEDDPADQAEPAPAPPAPDDEPEGEPEPEPPPRPAPLACDPAALGEWTGQFTGEIESDWGNTGAEGDINFEIVCSDRKLEVHGQMQGRGNVWFEYRSELEGFYAPSTNTLRADIVNGNVNLFLVQVGFAGEIVATLEDGEFNPGTWQGASTDPPGLNATGGGDWTARLR